MYKPLIFTGIYWYISAGENHSIFNDIYWYISDIHWYFQPRTSTIKNNIQKMFTTRNSQNNTKNENEKQKAQIQK